MNKLLDQMNVMKSKSLFVLVVIGVLMGCKKKEYAPIPEPAPWVGCVTVTDFETGEPIESVGVSWLWACCCQDMDYTDSSGTLCGMNEQIGDCSAATFTHGEYITETREMLPSTIQMHKKAYIKFNFSNAAPSTVDDTLILNVPQASTTYQYYYFGVGPFPDEIKIADPRYPSYTYYANGQWTTVPVSLTSGDTTEVWLDF